MKHYYQNPIKTQGDFADPFVLRYNGRYYLYCTNSDIRCWSSIDLVEWRLEGPTIKEGMFGDLVPFAPEVVYWNGFFYMYTSPSGHGHYVLRSTSPTGPFEKISENIGHSIDGSVLIDDNGQWYFYWAGEEGIWACKMDSPVSFGTPVLTGAFMNGWTEGPLLIKREGRYHMTYTGNHYLSKGYRINAVVSDQPLEGYMENPVNPIVIRTEGNVVGLGHSSSVLGPDLTSYYMVYHNLNPDRTRDLNIDRQIWNGMALQVLGPTQDKQPAPGLPDYYDFCNGQTKASDWIFFQGAWEQRDGFFQSTSEQIQTVWSSADAEKVYTAEFHLQTDSVVNAWADYGVLFGWKSNEDSYKLTFMPEENTVQLRRRQSGMERVLIDSPLPHDFNFSTLHCIRLICEEERFEFYLDNRRQITGTALGNLQGKIGYYSNGAVIRTGYTALTNDVEQSASNRALKPVPGRFWAANAVGKTTIHSMESGYEIVHLNAGDHVCYNLQVSCEESYVIACSGSFAEDTILHITSRGLNGVEETKETIHVVESEAHIKTLLRLPEGSCPLKIAVKQGAAVLSLIELFYASRESGTVANVESIIIGPYDKRVYGNVGWSDGTVEAELRFARFSENGTAGILFRATELAEGGEGDDPKLGIDFFNGYFLGLQPNRLFITKNSYEEKIISEVTGSWDLSVPHRIRLEVRDCSFRVFVDNMESPSLVCQDRLLPYSHGKAGIRARGCIVEVKNLAIQVFARNK